MSPELKAYRYYKKNIDQYLELMESFWGDDERLSKMYNDIASKFGGDGNKLMEINYEAYRRSIERAFR